jgi:tRNA pseudouridine55 synthase
MNGIIIIDKPTGMTSHDVVNRIRRISGVKRVGHGGTLDPLASGVLPILVGSATKLSQKIMDGDKEYIAGITFGKATDTDDSLGKVIREGPIPWDILERIKAVLPGFLGRIEQIPPQYSAIKTNGRPAYKEARMGGRVELKPRTVTVHQMDLIEGDLETFLFRVKCSKGTYIRALARDIGMTIGCPAHISSLRRTRCGQFSEDAAHPLEKLSTLQDLSHMLGTPKLL